MKQDKRLPEDQADYHSRPDEGAGVIAALAVAITIVLCLVALFTIYYLQNGG